MRFERRLAEMLPEELFDVGCVTAQLTRARDAGFNSARLLC
jgi:hypothetical protein